MGLDPGPRAEKINSALYFGGPQGMAGAMRNLVGIEPDYVMVTRFPFFEDMVDDIGGITVANPRRFSDPYLKKEGFGAGADPPRRLQRDGVLAHPQGARGR